MLKLNGYLAVLTLVVAYGHGPPAGAHQASKEGPNFHKFWETIDHDLEKTKAEIRGTVPDWIRGNKWNNGMGIYEGIDRKDKKDTAWSFNFLFDVLAYVSNWRFEEDGLYVQAKQVRGQYFNESRSEKPPFRTFAGMTPGMSAAEKISSITHFTSDNLNVNIIPFGDKIFAISDMSGYNIIDPETADYRGSWKWKDQENPLDFTEMITCAHPSQLPGDKHIYQYHAKILDSLNPKHGTHLHFWKVDTTIKGPQKRDVWYTLPIDDRYVSYTHSFAHTKNYIAFFEFNIFWDIMGIAKSPHILPNMRWDASRHNGTRIHILDKNNETKIKDMYAPPNFAYHHINAFEDGDEMVIDVAMTPKDHLFTAFNMTSLKANSVPIGKSQILRYRLNPTDDSRSVIPSVIPVKYWFDLIGINQNYYGKKYQWTYNLVQTQDGGWWDGISKTNMNTGEQLVWFQYDEYPTEPNFIPNPDGTDEDDGIVISQIYSGPENRSYLLGLDAKTWKEVFRAYAPMRLPFLSHGYWDGYVKQWAAQYD